MKYVLDFDRTLFDVERLYESLECQNIRHLAGTLESLDRLDVPRLLYPDAVPFLDTKQSTDVFVLSSSSGLSGEWEDEYQRAKITASGIGDLVAEVFVMSGMKGESLAGIAKRFPPDEPIIFIDDRIEQCLSVHAAVPQARCFLMVRDRRVVGEVAAVEGIPVISSFREVDAIMEGI